MCSYPEESSRPLSTMECQNAFDQLVSETEQPNAVDNSSPDEDNIPTLTKETIEKATEAFDDMPTDEALDEALDEGEADEVNETSNTELLEEDAPDEGVEEPNPVKEAFAKVAKEVDQQLTDECEGNCIKCENHCHDKVDVKVPSEDDKFKATCAIKYLHEKEIGQDNVVDHLDVIDDVYTTLTETQRELVTDEAPWLTAVFQDADIRKAERESAARKEAELEAAEEKSKRQGEELSRKIEDQLQAKQSEQLNIYDEAAKFNSWEAIINMWNDIPEAVKHSLQQMPGFDAFRVSMQNQKKIEAFHERINYDPEEMLKEMSKAHDLGNISTADAANLMDEPNMISNFMSTNPEFNKWNQERMDFSADKFDASTKRFEDLQKTGVIPPTNCGDRHNPLLSKCTKSIWGSTSDFGDTVRTGIMPSMGDVVKDGNGFGKGDCRVSDVFQQEFERVQRINAAHPIVSPKSPLTPEESLKQLMSDMPKSMVDKILSIPSDDWKFSYDGSGFAMKYSMASREIYLTMTSSAKFMIDYRNDGPGSVQYTRHFDKIEEIKLAGKQANRLYQWYGKVLAKFFNK